MLDDSEIRLYWVETLHPMSVYVPWLTERIMFRENEGVFIKLVTEAKYWAKEKSA